MKNSIFITLCFFSIGLAAQTAPTPSSPATTPGVSTTAPATPMPWTVSLKSEWSNNLEKAKTVGGALTDNQLRVAYKFNSNAQLGLLFGGKYTLASEKEDSSKQRMITSDTAIAGIYVVPEVLGADKLQLDGRLYLPTSTASRDNKQNGLLRADINIPYSLENQRAFKLYFKPRYFDYQVKESVFDTFSQVRIDQGKTIVPYVALNHYFKLSDKKSGMTRVEETAGPEIGLETQPHQLVKLNLRLAQARDILNPTKTKSQKRFSAFDPDESTYYLEAVVKM